MNTDGKNIFFRIDAFIGGAPSDNPSIDKDVEQFAEDLGIKNSPNKPRKIARCYLWRKRINRSGYDDMGVYYGVGQPLYGYEWKYGPTPVEYVCSDLRADDREHAKEKLRKRYPNITFYR